MVMAIVINHGPDDTEAQVDTGLSKEELEQAAACLLRTVVSRGGSFVSIMDLYDRMERSGGGIVPKPLVVKGGTG